MVASTITRTCTPRAAAEQLRGELKRIAENAEFREQIGRQGIDARTLAPGEWPAFIKAELEKWAKAVKQAGAQLD